MKQVVCILFAIISFSAIAQDHDLKKVYERCPFKMPNVVEPTFPDKVVNIKDFGAVANAKTLNTNAFASAIEACVKMGGGKVLVPAGTWLTGPIELKSNINLHLEENALVLFTPDRSQYPMIKPSPNSKNNYMVMPPLYAINAQNIAITGKGIFDGSGEAWRPLKKGKAGGGLWEKFLATGGVLSPDGKIWWPSSEAMNGEDYLKTLKGKDKLTEKDFLPARDFLRPKMVVFSNCKNVLYAGVTFRNSPSFVINPQHIENLTIRNVKVHNEWWAQNGDGIDVSACKNVLIYNTTVNAGDDGICMKSSGGKGLGAELENILIANCIVYRAHGGFVIGSNTDGGMNNIFVTDCLFLGTDIGVRVKSNAGRGGLVNNIFVENIEMKNIVNEAILFDTYYEDVPAGKEKTITKATDKIPEFTKCYLKNIHCAGAATAISIMGLPQMPVHNIYFENMEITAKKGFVSKDAKDIFLKQVKLNVPTPIYDKGNCENIVVE